MPLPAALALAKPFLAAAWGVLSKIPAWVWVALAAALAVWLYGAHERSEGRKEERAAWEKEKAQMVADHEAAINVKRGQVADWVLKGLADRDKLAAQQREREALYEQRVAEVNQRRTTYVTKVAAARCDLTRGVVLAFNDGAATANGEERGAGPAPADASPEAIDATAKVSLDHYTAAIGSTQAALGRCREQVIGWQEHWGLVVEWYAGLRQILEAVP